jgi:preprotein translocase subunit YajC
MRVPTALLLAALVAGISFWGGSTLQKHHGATASAAGAANFAALRNARARGTSGGSPGQTGSGSGGTAGTVTVIQGNTVWVTAADGSLVKVQLTKATTVTRNATTTKSALRPGDTVVVQGAAAKNGTVTASSVAATAKGVSPAGPGGFPGGAGG